MTLAVVLFILWLIVRGSFKAYPFISRLVKLVNTLVGDKDNPGIGDRMDAQDVTLDNLSTTVETVRSQVQNSHQTNLRDDVDKVINKLDQHLATSESQDKEQKETTKKLDEHIAETSEWTPMIKDLHSRYVNKDLGKE